MSKIGKKNIVIPKESSIKIEGANLTITGPKGTKKLTINDKVFLCLSSIICADKLFKDFDTEILYLLLLTVFSFFLFLNFLFIL